MPATRRAPPRPRATIDAPPARHADADASPAPPPAPDPRPDAGRARRLRRAAWRRVLLAVHLWVGLASGGVLSVVGLTGSLYTFAPELGAALNRDLYAARPPAPDAAPLSAADVARRAAEQRGRTVDAVQSIQWPQRERATYQIKLFGDESWWFVDPYTGRVLGRDRDRPSARAAEWLLLVHTSLGMGDVGRTVVGAAALLLALVLVSTGVWLWWPRTAARRRAALRVDLRAPRARRLFDLHSVPGVYAALPLVVLALSGAAWSFPDAARRVADGVTGAAPTPADFWDARSGAPAGRRPLTLGEVLARTEGEFPGYVRRNLWMAGDSTGALYASWHRTAARAAGGEYRPMLFLDRHSGAALVRYDPERAGAGTRLLHVWFPPVHVGEVGGLPGRVLVCVAGLVPLALTVTGVRIWRRRAGGRGARGAAGDRGRSRPVRGAGPATG